MEAEVRRAAEELVLEERSRKRAEERRRLVVRSGDGVADGLKEGKDGVLKEGKDGVVEVPVPSRQVPNLPAGVPSPQKMPQRRSVPIEMITEPTQSKLVGQLIPSHIRISYSLIRTGRCV